MMHCHIPEHFCLHNTSKLIQQNTWAVRRFECYQLCHLQIYIVYSWCCLHVMLAGVSSILCYLGFLHITFPGVSSMLCYLDFLTFCVTWSFFHVMLAGVSSMLCYLEFLPYYVTWGFFHIMYPGVSSMLC